MTTAPTLNPAVAQREAEERQADIDSLECAAGLIEQAMEKVELQEKFCTSYTALDAFADAINALDNAAATLRHAMKEM